MEIVIRAENLTKQYPGVLANNRINFEVQANTVHALVGENGAGKSTLVKMLYGIIPKTSGKIFVKGKEVSFNGAQDAIKVGVGMVHQHFRLIPNLTVAENIILGNEPGSKFYLNRAKAYEKVAELSEKYGLDIDPRQKIEDVSIGQQQRTEILRALYIGSDILILDEPTAVLTPQEIDELGLIIQRLKEMGKTIIVITHKLEEVMNFTDNITVLRLGNKIGDLVTSKTTPEEITEMMVGRSVSLGGSKGRSKIHSDKYVLEVKDLNYTCPRGKSLKNIDFKVKVGEILGIAGVDGSGQSELLDIISGARKSKSGNVIMNGININYFTIRERRENSFGYIPQDRHKEGLLLNFSIEQNLLLGFEDSDKYRKRWNFLNLESIKKDAIDRIKLYDIRTPNEMALASSLSGGNQQKIIIARETCENPDFVLAAQPTRGLDIGAIEFVHDTLVDLRNHGKGVMVVSFELDELLELCDRIIVMCAGEITGVLNASEFDKEKIGLMMVGKKNEEIIRSNI